MASKPVNPYLADRILKSTQTFSSTDQLFQFQEALFHQNEVALDLLASKFGGVMKSTSKILKNFQSPSLSPAANSASCAHAAARAQNQSGKHGLDVILPLVEKRPADIGLVMTVVQLYILTNNHGAAISLMESLIKRLEQNTSSSSQDVRFAPGLVSTLVSLYSIEGRRSHIKQELANAARYWLHKPNSNPSLMKAAAYSFLQSGSPEDLKQAGAIFEKMQAQNPDDKFVKAGLVASYATINRAKIRFDADALTTVERLTADIDVDRLEKVGLSQAVPTTSTLSRKRPAEGSNPRKKRVRKLRFPKDYDPSKPVDPERWLPLRDRSTYRPKGKKGKQKASATMQGGMSAETADGAVKQAGTTLPIVGAKGKSKKSKK